MSGANKSDFPDSDTRYAEALEELTQSIETSEPLEDVRGYSRPSVDVAALRRSLGLTQQDFADQFGIALGTLRNWEQGRRVPDGPAQLLLLILEQRPDVALDIFRDQEVQAESLAGNSVKSPEAFRTISEVSGDLGVRLDVLRFWETRFAQIKPMKRGGGRRLYRPDHVALLRGIKALLYDDGMTIKGVQKVLREKGAKTVIARGTREAVDPEGTRAGLSRLDAMSELIEAIFADMAAGTGEAVDAETIRASISQLVEAQLKQVEAERALKAASAP